MTARDEAWICPQHPFGHTWTGKLRCSLCGAERSAADAIVSGLGSARGWAGPAAERVRDAHRAEVLREAADVINALPQDYECDPGRGNAAELLRRMADEASTP